MSSPFWERTVPGSPVSVLFLAPQVRDRTGVYVCVCVCLLQARDASGDGEGETEQDNTHTDEETTKV